MHQEKQQLGVFDRDASAAIHKQGITPASAGACQQSNICWTRLQNSFQQAIVRGETTACMLTTTRNKLSACRTWSAVQTVSTYTCARQQRTCLAAASACPAAADTGTTVTPGSCSCSHACQAAAAAAGTRSHLLSSSTSGSLWCCVMWRYSACEKCSSGFLQGAYESGTWQVSYVVW
jgi:hypothetical protein